MTTDQLAEQQPPVADIHPPVYPDGPEDDEQWENTRLDLDAYLARIGYDGPLAADGPTLTALHRAHIATVPFENLDILLGAGIAVDLRSVHVKLVGRRRGGYCFEQNTLLAAVLERLGMRVNRLLARVGDETHKIRPRSHLVLDVQTGDGRWLADVGFGSGLLEPVPLTGAAPVTQGGWTYRLEPGGSGYWRLREYRDGQWVTLYGFTGEPQHAVDIEVANHYTATWSRSPFRSQPVVIRKDETSVRQLIGRRFAVTGPGRAEEAREVSDAELGDVLSAEFGLEFTPAETAVLAAAQPS